MPTKESKGNRAPVTADKVNHAGSGVQCGSTVQEEVRKLRRHHRAKKIVSLESALATFVLVVALSLNAQQPTPTPAPPTTDQNVSREQVNDANIQLMRQDIRAQRKKIVAASMPLTETEATKFWPLYDRYVGETIKVNDARFALIKEYAQNYENMTDAQAAASSKLGVLKPIAYQSCCCNYGCFGSYYVNGG